MSLNRMLLLLLLCDVVVCVHSTTCVERLLCIHRKLLSLANCRHLLKVKVRVILEVNIGVREMERNPRG